MTVIISTANYGGSGGGSSAYSNFAARCTSAGATLTGADATNYQTLLDGLTTDGFFDGAGASTFFDCLYILAAPSSTVALLDLTNNAHNLTVSGSPTFAANRGYTGQDLAIPTAFLNTNFNPGSGSGSPNYTINSAHLMSWINGSTTPTNGGATIGVANGANQQMLMPIFADTHFYSRINDGSAGGSVGTVTAVGHYLGSRDGVNTEQAYHNTTAQTANTATSSAVLNGNIYILANHDLTAAASSGSLNQVSAASIGSQISSGNNTLFYNRLRTFMTAVGVS